MYLLGDVVVDQLKVQAGVEMLVFIADLVEKMACIQDMAQQHLKQAQ